VCVCARSNVGRIPIKISGHRADYQSQVNITSVDFSNNANHQSYGGAIRIVDSPGTYVSLDDVLFSRNDAYIGGAIYCSTASTTLHSDPDAPAASQSETPTTRLIFSGTQSIFQNNQAEVEGPDVFIDVSAPCQLSCFGDMQQLCQDFLLSRQVADHDRESGFAVASGVVGVFLLVGLATVGCFVAGIAFVRSVNKMEAQSV
jgi:predicted outer membrane repeat protein